MKNVKAVRLQLHFLHADLDWRVAVYYMIDGAWHYQEAPEYYFTPCAVAAIGTMERLLTHYQATIGRVEILPKIKHIRG